MYSNSGNKSNEIFLLQSTKVTIQSHYTSIATSINKILLTLFLGKNQCKKSEYNFTTK